MKKIEQPIHQQEISRNEELLRARQKTQGDQMHHFEEVAMHKGVSWINHSTATNVDLTWMALRDIPGPVILIIGGIDRADDHVKLIELASQKVNGVVCLGPATWKYFHTFSKHVQIIVQAEDMKEAVENAFLLARGEVKTVLFAPACPSYDPFDNYKNRGNLFRRVVKEKIAAIETK
jgi:UDP-N-acetylmuramoylalanine--D-glutamate ligase